MHTAVGETARHRPSRPLPHQFGDLGVVAALLVGGPQPGSSGVVRPGNGGRGVAALDSVLNT